MVFQSLRTRTMYGNIIVLTVNRDIEKLGVPCRRCSANLETRRDDFFVKCGGTKRSGQDVPRTRMKPHRKMFGPNCGQMYTTYAMISTMEVW